MRQGFSFIRLSSFTKFSFSICKTIRTFCSDLNGRPLINPSKDEDVEKRGKLTDEQKAELDSISGATMSLNDAHGDLISSIEKAAELSK